MQIKGKITQILEPVKDETWVKQGFVIDTGEKYDNVIAVEVFGEDNVRKFGGFKVGTLVNCDINIKCREYNGRWYTNLSAWKVWTEKQADEAPDEPEDDLPF